MSYTLRKRGNTWHADCVDRDGRRHRTTTGQTDKRRADIVAAEWFRKLGDPTYRAADATTIRSAAESLIEELRQAGRSKATIEHFYRIKLSHIARVLGEDTPLAKIERRKVQGYIIQRGKDEGRVEAYRQQGTDGAPDASKVRKAGGNLRQRGLPGHAGTLRHGVQAARATH
jgi:hypothetical protein